MSGACLRKRCSGFAKLRKPTETSNFSANRSNQQNVGLIRHRASGHFDRLQEQRSKMDLCSTRSQDKDERSMKKKFVALLPPQTPPGNEMAWLPSNSHFDCLLLTIHCLAPASFTHTLRPTG